MKWITIELLTLAREYKKPLALIQRMHLFCFGSICILRNALEEYEKSPDENPLVISRNLGDESRDLWIHETCWNGLDEATCEQIARMSANRDEAQRVANIILAGDCGHDTNLPT